MDERAPWDALDDEVDSPEAGEALVNGDEEEVFVEVEEEAELDLQDLEEGVEDEDYKLEEDFQDQLQAGKLKSMRIYPYGLRKSSKKASRSP